MWMAVGLMVWLGVLGIMDIRAGKIPVWAVTLGIVAAAVSACVQCLAGMGNWGDVFCSLIPGGILLIVSKVTEKVGSADGMVLMAIGMVLKAGGGFFVFVLSMFALAIFSIILLLVGSAGKNTKLPYLPFLWLACLVQICLVWV